MKVTFFASLLYQNATFTFSFPTFYRLFAPIITYLSTHKHWYVGSKTTPIFNTTFEKGNFSLSSIISRKMNKFDCFLLCYILYHFLLPDEMRIVRISEKGFKLKFLIAEGTKVVGLCDAMLNDESRHGSTTGLGPYGLHLQVILASLR